MVKRIIAEAKKLTTDLGQMTFRQKVDHLWSYYKGALVGFLVMCMTVSIIITCVRNIYTQTLIAGITVNVNLSECGMQFLSEDYMGIYGANNDEAEALINTTQLKNVADTQSMNENYYSLMGILSLCASNDLDYLIVDDEALRTLMPQGIFMDLTEFFTETEMTQYSGMLINMEIKDEGVITPVAINISDLPFVDMFVQQEGDIYFTVVCNTKRIDACRELWLHLINYQ